jgi:hypothetical protein
MWDSAGRVSGLEWFLVALAFLADLSSHAGSGRRRGRR